MQSPKTWGRRPHSIAPTPPPTSKVSQFSADSNNSLLDADCRDVPTHRMPCPIRVSDDRVRAPPWSKILILLYKDLLYSGLQSTMAPRRYDYAGKCLA